MLQGELEDVANEAGVAEVSILMRHSLTEICFQRHRCLWRDGVFELLESLKKYLVKFIGIVVRKLDVAAEPRLQSGVGVDERLHFIRVAGQDYHQSFAVILHAL